MGPLMKLARKALPILIGLLGVGGLAWLMTQIIAGGALDSVLGKIKQEQKADAQVSATLETAGAKDTALAADKAATAVEGVRSKADGFVRKVYQAPGANTPIPPAALAELRAADLQLCGVRPAAIQCPEGSGPEPGRPAATVPARKGAGALPGVHAAEPGDTDLR